ncbi:MAG: M48 family metalloprotease [Treponema sp.]|jgi:predicted Zn-dependent protease|nr:M48 family metalloprotease [Treponema sp.]
MKKSLGILLFVCLAAALGAQNQGQKGGAAPSGRNNVSGDIAGAFSEMDRAFDVSDEELTPEDEYYLGRAVAAQILNTYTLYDGDPAMVSYLNKICQAIVINSSQPVMFNGYHVGILNTREINAFATPGGHIFITRGLLECADSEDALAAVIAHEVAHMQLHHAAAIISDQRLVNELSQAADRAAGIASRNAGPQQRAALFSRSIGAMAATLFKNGFAQDQEFEADAAAAALLRSAGYDSSAIITVLKVLERVQPSRPGGFNTTHPSPAARMASLKNVALAGDGRNARVRNARFVSFQRRLKAMP